MRILLMDPNYDSHVVHPPLGLGYLASYLEKENHLVSIFDGTLKNADEEDFLKVVSDFKPDLVGVSVLTRGHNRAKKMIKTIKAQFRSLPVVIGGTQVTAAPEIVLRDLGADFAVIGEGEITILELVRALEKDKGHFERVKGLAYKDKRKGIIVTEPRELIADIDTIPFPAWHLMPPKDYRIAPILEPARAFPIAPILTSRGCSYNCSFCASNVTWRRKLRFRSIKNVLKEIKLLKNRYGVREIHFCDDNFTMNVKRAQEMCDTMIQERIDLPWQCPNGVRIDGLTTSLLEGMRKAGCYALGLGVESGSRKILKRVNKQLDLGVVKKALSAFKNAGISSYGFFILGLPGDTMETIEETIQFALSNPFNRAWFNIFTPYPGSIAFDEWIGNRDFAEIDWDEYDCSTAIVASEELTPEVIEKLQRQALRRFYLRPRILFSLIISLNYHSLVTLMMSRFLSKRFVLFFRIVHRFIRKKR
ncbi:MAG: radical SAM protein [bacterium]